MRNLTRKTRMKKQLTLRIVDVPADVTPEVKDALILAMFEARRRLKTDKLTDWRDVAKDVIGKRFVNATVHMGGHHIALHFPGPMHFGSIESGPCGGRIIEDFELVEVAA